MGCQSRNQVHYFISFLTLVMVHPFAVLSAFIACSVSVVADVEKTRYFNQTLDHFNAQTNGGELNMPRSFRSHPHIVLCCVTSPPPPYLRSPPPHCLARTLAHHSCCGGCFCPPLPPTHSVLPAVLRECHALEATARRPSLLHPRWRMDCGSN
jgi:hypothetical protein